MEEYRYQIEVRHKVLLKLLSDILSPPVFATFIFAAICFRIVPTAGNAFALFSICFLFQSLLPVVYLFTTLKMQTISDIHLFHKEERNLVFPTLVAFYVSGFIVLHVMHAPGLIAGLMFSSTVLIILIWIINQFHKISVHAMGVAGLLTGMFFAFGSKAFTLEPIVALAAWVRYRTGAHAISQILTGATLGHTVTYLVLKYFMMS